jgi:hypothetical protein
MAILHKKTIPQKQKGPRHAGLSFLTLINVSARLEHAKQRQNDNQTERHAQQPKNNRHCRPPLMFRV